MIKTTFGLKEGRAVHIDEVKNSGLACGCTCRKCEEKLVAKIKGGHRVPHFAHYTCQ